MALKGDLAQILCGVPVRVAGCNIAVSQPSIKEICAFGENDFLASIQVFVHIDKLVSPIKQGNSRLAMLSDFQVLIVALEEDKELKEQINRLFELIFPDYVWQFDAGSINFRIEEKGPIVGQLNPMNFDNFKETLRTLFIPYNISSEESSEEFNPANDRAAEIAAKLKRGREQRAEMQRKEKGDAPSSIFAAYISILAIGLKMDMNVFFNYTPFQLFDTFMRFNREREYDIYLKIATIPFADSSKLEEPDPWLGNLYE